MRAISRLHPPRREDGLTQGAALDHMNGGFTMTKQASIKAVVAATAAAFSLSGCYIVPVGPDGVPAAYIPVAPPPAFPGQNPATQQGQPSMPKVLYARLYPSNDLASQTGMVSGTVTNMMTGKGRFQLNYQGETLTGEATRVSGDSRKGVASAYSQNGSFMTCDYQMSSPTQGAGTCQFSNGARYQVHIGN